MAYFVVKNKPCHGVFSCGMFMTCWKVEGMVFERLSDKRKGRAAGPFQQL